MLSFVAHTPWEQNTNFSEIDCRKKIFPWSVLIDSVCHLLACSRQCIVLFTPCLLADSFLLEVTILFFSPTPVEGEATLFFPAGVVKPPGEGEDKYSSFAAASIWVCFIMLKKYRAVRSIVRIKMYGGPVVQIR